MQQAHEFVDEAVCAGLEFGSEEGGEHDAGAGGGGAGATDEGEAVDVIRVEDAGCDEGEDIRVLVLH